MEKSPDIRQLLAQLPFPVGLFGSCLLKPYQEAGDIDMVVERPGRHMKRLKKLAAQTQKPLDVFIPPLRENEWTSKVFIRPDGSKTTDMVYCGKDFFEGLTLVNSPNQKSQNEKSA